MSANVDSNVHARGQHKSAPVYQRLRTLLEDRDPPCLSLYQPTFRAFPDIQQNPIRYRNLLRELKTALEQKFAGADAGALLAGFERLADDREFWAHPQDGIVVLGASGFFHAEKLQRAVAEQVAVADRLHLKPLVRIFQSADSYQVLALDREAIRLYQGNRYVLDEIVMAPSVPRTIRDALGEPVTLQAVERMGEFGPGRGGQREFIHHGHGSKKDETGLDIERFFRAVDRAIMEAHSKPSELPLILAALPEYHSHFRALSHNPYLLDEGIHTNADARSTDELRDAAWRVMEPRYHARLKQILDEYGAAVPRGLASDDLTHVLEFALDGRVGTLIIEADRRIPGHIEGRMPRFDDAGEPAASDLLDAIAECVLKTGGQVVVAPHASMPTHTGLAAVFRY